MMRAKWMIAGTSMALAAMMFASAAFAQRAPAGSKPAKPQASPYAQVTQEIGVEKVTITYHRPGVKGREIWGTNLAAYDKPWRAGANHTTVIEFTGDVKINGEAVPAGKYGFHIIPRKEGKWTLIFNKEWETWGSFQYKQDQDQLRIDVDPEDAPMQERLLYSFDELTDNSAVCSMHWEKKKVSFKIETTG